MPPNEPFAELMARLANQEEGAVAVIAEAYTRRLIGLARRRLDHRLRAKIDPEDIAQSALKSFFRRQVQGEFSFDNEGGLWALLTEITLRKCGKWNSYFRALKRDVDREGMPERPNEESSWQVPDHAPAAEDVAALNDTLEHLLHGLTETQRLLVELRLLGHSVEEIATHLNISERTVSRNLKVLRERLRGLTQDPDDSSAQEKIP